MTNKKLLECLFGHHQYSNELTIDKTGRSIHLCKYCKRSGLRDESGSMKTWYDYDEEGNCLYIKDVQGEEYRRNKNGAWEDGEGNKASY